MTFINASKDVAWLKHLLAMHSDFKSMYVLDAHPEKCVTIRFFRKVDPLYLDKPDDVKEFNGPGADTLAQAFRERFPKSR